MNFSPAGYPWLYPGVTAMNAPASARRCFSEHLTPEKG